jgi:hypothetical protein
VLVERHILPLLREHGVRYVQVARGGRSTSDGLVILGDSRTETRCHTEGGPWTLYSEMTEAGTVPQFRTGERKCSLHFKGEPLDAWLREEMNGRGFRHVMGFNADEMFRVERDSSYSTEQRASEYPLVAWGWGREACEAFLAETFGEPWTKSCCTFCPFACNKAGIAAHMARLANFPEAAADIMVMERTATALNATQTLYSGKSVETMLEAQPAAVAARDIILASTTWAVYRVRRAFAAKANAARSVQRVDEGTRDEMVAALAERGAVEEEGRHLRVWITRRAETFPHREELYVVAPALVVDKERKGFDARWAAAAVAPELEPVAPVAPVEPAAADGKTEIAVTAEGELLVGSRAIAAARAAGARIAATDRAWKLQIAQSRVAFRAAGAWAIGRHRDAAAAGAADVRRFA